LRGHTSYEDTNEVVDAIVESGAPLDIDAHAHDIIEFAPELAKLASLIRSLGIHSPHL